jgi:adenosyl cobinamide kinase/adenosyl cobinamide phosphate guanylyltransferase
MNKMATPGQSTKTLYDSDFYAWTKQQAQLLRSHQWDLVDIENLVEEIESLGRQERQELVNRLATLLGHLLKWEYQPEQRSNSWLATIREQRRKVIKLIEQNPSLKLYLEEVLQEAYEDGIDLAVRETNLPYKTFPEICPYTLQQTLNPEFLPGATENVDNE